MTSQRLNTTTTISNNAGAEIGGVVNTSMSVSSSTSFVKDLYYHGSVGYLIMNRKKIGILQIVLCLLSTS